MRVPGGLLTTKQVNNNLKAPPARARYEPVLTASEKWSTHSIVRFGFDV
jgi:hypothetical protein